MTKATRGESVRQIAAKIHRSHTSVRRWIISGDPPAEVVITLARAYGADPLAGLVAAGCLTIEELTPQTRSFMRHAPLSFLTDELHYRARRWELARQTGETFTPWFPLPMQRVHPDGRARVTDFPGSDN